MAYLLVGRDSEKLRLCELIDRAQEKSGLVFTAGRGRDLQTFLIGTLDQHEGGIRGQTTVDQLREEVRGGVVRSMEQYDPENSFT